jgi:SAM-dependent methyltransferase
MVEAAWLNGIPALLQRAERPLFRDESVDAVLLAYGTHHIAVEARADMIKDCYRILRSEGSFVLHDFLVGSPMDIWFEQAVHPHSLTGHQYAHFTSDEIGEYLVKAGFDSCEIMEIDDPYVATGHSPEEAQLALGEYLVNMYGLCKVRDSLGDRGAFRWAAEKALDIFRYHDNDGTVIHGTVEYVDRLGAWQFTLPRKAIVGVGRKL